MQYKLTFFTIVFAGMLTQGYAQKNKQPQVQQNSIWMEGFEADGKLDEWQQPLQAYNDDTHIAYSLANDDQYLYLAVKTNRTQKVFRGGVSLLLKGKNNIEITYPYNPTYDMSSDELIMKAFNDNTQPRVLADFDKIETVGLTQGRDSIIYLTNEYGVEAGIEKETIETEIYRNGADFYNIEIAIPIQYLPFSDDGMVEYIITLRGIKVNQPIGQKPIMPAGYDPNDTPRIRNDKDMKAVDSASPTKLTGTYRLATKPD
ncbi:hypothetical protein [Sphingobacterium paucimobilis]|uniref:Uncharacterized protein n=1 Tax=Sphingobacterium paucimobilis HER1398 TaxID=1346330 RepID=U2IYX0_9SPHI|nr:hypothetical protein [Sphingobacterium paucimobilis]ERJ57904.1 hypothetical protein M472_03905 [Sphingobacterium paucimobilis HER1398]